MGALELIDLERWLWLLLTGRLVSGNGQDSGPKLSVQVDTKRRKVFARYVISIQHKSTLLIDSLGELFCGFDFFQGDSGGPLVCNTRVVGIVSYTGRTCDYPDLPNVYTDIQKFLPWINDPKAKCKND